MHFEIKINQIIEDAQRSEAFFIFPDVYSFEKTMKFYANSLNYFSRLDNIIQLYLNSFIF